MSQPPMLVGAEIEAGYGLVVTDPAGGKLLFTLDDGKTSEIADGTLVQLTDWPAGKSHDQARHISAGKPVQELTSEDAPVVSPAYSPSGTLYVRNDDGAVYEVAGGKLKQVGQGRKPKRDQDGDFASPLPVQFDDKGAWKLPGSEQPAHRPKQRKP